MKGPRRTNLDTLVVIASVALTMFMLYAASLARSWFAIGRPLVTTTDATVPLALYFVVAAIWLTVFLGLSAQQLLWSPDLLDGLRRLAFAAMINDLVFAGVLYLGFRDIPRLLFIYFTIFNFVGLVALFLFARWALLRQLQHDGVRKRVLVVGAGQSGMRIATALEQSRPCSTTVIGFLDLNPALLGQYVQHWPVLGNLADAPRIIANTRIEEVVVALPIQDHPEAVALVRQIQSLPIQIRLVPDLLDFAVMGGSVEYLEGMPVVGLRVSALSDDARLLKRLFDIVVSAALLLAVSPLMAIVALLIRFDSRGPVFYYANRVGENGRPFTMVKFRSMVVDAETRLGEVSVRGHDGKLRFKHPDDPRITRVGAWLRRTSLDELPQLLNVLRGEMSLVGPRPELPDVVQYEYEPWQWSRFTVPQGMTGWWQINRRGYEHQHLCTADDLYYIQNYSLQLDLLILLKTIGVVLRGEGAY